MRFTRIINKKILITIISILVIVCILSIVYKKIGVKEDGYYFLDVNGNIIYSHPIEPSGGNYISGYIFGEDGYAYCERLCSTNENGDYMTSGIIDDCGNIVGDKKIDENDISVGSENTFPIMLFEDGKIVIYDKDFQKIGQVENTFGANEIRVGSGFSEGLGSVWICVGDKLVCGYINTKGEWVIEPRFNGGSLFTKDGIARVKDPETDLWSYIDTEGNEVINEHFYDASDFSEGFALVQKEKDGKAAYINAKGEYITDFIFDYSKSQPGFSEGMACVSVYGEDNYGYINEHGEIVIKPQYRSAGRFSCGLAPVSVYDYTSVYINKEGEKVIDFTDEGVICYPFTKDGYATVYDFVKCKYGIIDTNGEWLFRMQFIKREKGLPFDYEVPVFENGHCFVYLEKGQIIKKPKKK